MARTTPCPTTRPSEVFKQRAFRSIYVPSRVLCVLCALGEVCSLVRRPPNPATSLVSNHLRLKRPITESARALSFESPRLPTAGRCRPLRAG
jgi:hypothetical protein